MKVTGTTKLLSWRKERATHYSCTWVFIWYLLTGGACIKWMAYGHWTEKYNKREEVERRLDDDGWWTTGGTTWNNQVNLLATFFFHFHSRAKRPRHSHLVRLISRHVRFPQSNFAALTKKIIIGVQFSLHAIINLIQIESCLCFSLLNINLMLHTLFTWTELYFQSWLTERNLMGPSGVGS